MSLDTSRHKSNKLVAGAVQFGARVVVRWVCSHFRRISIRLSDAHKSKTNISLYGLRRSNIASGACTVYDDNNGWQSVAWTCNIVQTTARRLRHDHCAQEIVTKYWRRRDWTGAQAATCSATDRLWHRCSLTPCRLSFAVVMGKILHPPVLVIS